jgi:hypothetical protein
MLQFDIGANLELLDLRRLASNSDREKLPSSFSRVCRDPVGFGAVSV